jgi:hypothetical protein
VSGAQSRALGALAYLEQCARRAGWTRDDLGDWSDRGGQLMVSDSRFWRPGEIDPEETPSRYLAMLNALYQNHVPLGPR